MDPDAIFIMLLYFILFVITVASIIGLSRKLWNGQLPKPVKLFFVGMMLLFLVITLLKFSGPADSVWWTIGIIFLPSLLIGLNSSINIIGGNRFERIKLSPNIKIIILTILFTLLIPAAMFLIGNFFDWLNVMGSSG